MENWRRGDKFTYVAEIQFHDDDMPSGCDCKYEDKFFAARMSMDIHPSDWLKIRRAFQEESNNNLKCSKKEQDHIPTVVRLYQEINGLLHPIILLHTRQF